MANKYSEQILVHGEDLFDAFTKINTALAKVSDDLDTTLANAIKVINSLKDKQPVALATTANIVLSGEQTIDGVQAVSGDRVLVKNQTNPIENGIYVVHSDSWVRADDGVTGTLHSGDAVRADKGTENSMSTWIVSNLGDITVGTTPVTFAVFPYANMFKTTGNISINGRTISLVPTGVAAGTYSLVTVDKDGRVVTAQRPQSLWDLGITDPMRTVILAHNNSAETVSDTSYVYMYDATIFADFTRHRPKLRISAVTSGMGQCAVSIIDGNSEVIAEFPVAGGTSMRQIIDVDCSSLMDISEDATWTVAVYCKALTGEFTLERFSMQAIPYDSLVTDILATGSPGVGFNNFSNANWKLLETRNIPSNFAQDSNFGLKVLAKALFSATPPSVYPSTFSRASIAYLGPYPFASGAPRINSDGLLLERAATNCLAAGAENMGTPWTTNTGAVTVTDGADKILDLGDTTYKQVSMPATASVTPKYSISTTQGGWYKMFTAYIKVPTAPASGTGITVTLRDSSGAPIDSTTVLATDGWKKVNLGFGSSSAGSTCVIDVGSNATVAGGNLVFQITQPMLFISDTDRNTYDPGYVPPGVSRATEVLTLPPGTINPSLGTIEFDFVYDGTRGGSLYSGASPSDCTLMSLGNAADTNMVRLKLNCTASLRALSTAKLELDSKKDSGSTQYTVVTTSDLTAGKHSLKVTWGNGLTKLYLDGSKVGECTMSDGTISGTGVFFSPNKSVISNLRVSSTIRSASELAYTGKLSADSYTSWYSPLTTPNPWAFMPVTDPSPVKEAGLLFRVTGINGQSKDYSEVPVSVSDPSKIYQADLLPPNTVDGNMTLEIFGRIQKGTSGYATLDHYELWLEI